MVEAKGGAGASVQFDGATVTLTRTRRSLPGYGERQIPVGQIAAVTWEPPGRLASGAIRFVVAGTVTPRTSLGQRSLAAVKDEWTVPFPRRVEADFLAVRDAVQRVIVARTR
jgi:hypothetical protein